MYSQRSVLGAAGPAAVSATSETHPLANTTNPASPTNVFTLPDQLRPFSMNALPCTDRPAREPLPRGDATVHEGARLSGLGQALGLSRFSGARGSIAPARAACDNFISELNLCG